MTIPNYDYGDFLDDNNLSVDDLMKETAQYDTYDIDDKTKLGMIFIEDISDKIFWEKIAFNHVVKLYSENDKAITGKSKLLQICSANQLIAIDSDFDDLCPQHRPESVLCSDKKDYILKTYTHSLENLTFSPECLYEILETKFKLYIDDYDNSIMFIFQKLSEIWFEPYLKFLFLKNNKIKVFSNKKWIQAIRFQGKESQDIALKKDFHQYENRLSLLNQQLNQYISNQTEFQLFCKYVTQQGFEKQNVWAYIRGHDLEEKFVIPIIEMICSHRIKQEMAYIKEHHQDNKNRKAQCQNIFQKQSGIQTVLHHYFYDAYFPQAKETDVFLQKIVADYAKIIQAA